MKKTYFLMGALAMSLLCACHHHEHGEEGHDHEAETTEADAHGEHEGHHADEIILTAEKAKAAGLQVEAVSPGKFRQVVKTGGQILAAQGEETTVVAPTSGVVRFARTLVSGTSVGRGTTLFRLSSD